MRVNGEGVASAPEACGRDQFRKGIRQATNDSATTAASDGVSGGDVEHVRSPSSAGETKRAEVRSVPRSLEGRLRELDVDQPKRSDLPAPTVEIRRLRSTVASGSRRRGLSAIFDLEVETTVGLDGFWSRAHDARERPWLTVDASGTRSRAVALLPADLGLASCTPAYRRSQSCSAAGTVQSVDRKDAALIDGHVLSGHVHPACQRRVRAPRATSSGEILPGRGRSVPTFSTLLDRVQVGRLAGLGPEPVQPP